MSLIGTRPNSLYEVSIRVLDGADYVACMKELVDEMALRARVVGSPADPRLSGLEGFISEEPARLPNAEQRAHLGGMAEFVARLSVIEPPDWVENDDFFLEEPVFVGGPRSREIFMAETPSAFRRRNLFCGRVAERLTSLLQR